MKAAPRWALHCRPDNIFFQTPNSVDVPSREQAANSAPLALLRRTSIRSQISDKSIPAAKMPPQTGTNSQNAPCTHLTMTCLYSDEAVCDSCHHTAPLGWLFCCTQDHEPAILSYINKGRSCSSDKIVCALNQKVKSATNAREDHCKRYSLMAELPYSDLARYSPDQLAFLTEQRDQVRRLIHHTGHEGANKHELQEDDLPGSQPCLYKTCLSCRSGCVERSFLSLSGIANGDIPASAATGFGFHTKGGRPVADVAIVKNIGLGLCPKTVAGRGEDQNTQHGFFSWCGPEHSHQTMVKYDDGGDSLLSDSVSSVLSTSTESQENTQRRGAAHPRLRVSVSFPSLPSTGSD